MIFFAQGLSIARGGRSLVARLDLSVHSGEALIITGRNGAGKSTLLRAFAGMLPLHEGKIELAGHDGAPEGAMHYLGHANGQKPQLTALENLAFWRRLLASDDAGLSPHAALEAFGIGALANFHVGYLSAGQARRVALARLLVAARPLWLLDEPLTALDSASQALLTNVLRDHLRNGGIIIAATHAGLDVPARELRLGELDLGEMAAGDAA